MSRAEKKSYVFKCSTAQRIVFSSSCIMSSVDDLIARVKVVALIKRLTFECENCVQ